MKSKPIRNKYYCTFGQGHINTLTGEIMKDYWIEVWAETKTIAMRIMIEKYRYKWAEVYTIHQFNKSYYSKGKYEELRSYITGNYYPLTSEEIAIANFEEKLKEIYEQRRNNGETSLGEGVGDGQLLP